MNIRGASSGMVRNARAAIQGSSKTNLASFLRTNSASMQRYYAVSSRPPSASRKPPTSGTLPRQKFAEKVHSSVEYVEFPPEVDIAIKRIGFTDAKEIFQRLLNILLKFMRARWSSAKVASKITTGDFLRMMKAHKRLESKDEKLLTDSKTVGQAIYAISISRMPPHMIDAGWFEFGRFGLVVATELGCYDAALRLWHEDVAQGLLISGAARKLVEAAALNRSDIRAMALYLRQQLDNSSSTPASREQAYVFAKDLFAMVEPRHVVVNSADLLDRHDAPWRLLRDAADQRLFDCRSGPAHQEAQETYEFAIREGATKYDDPEACHSLSEFPTTKVYSDTWLELKTKSAMNGDADDCFQVGKYWLETSGYYPGDADKRPIIRGSVLGLHWLELAAVHATDNAQAMASRFLALALLIREHGLMAQGREWLGLGIRLLTDTALDESDAKQWIDKLRSFEQNWDTEFGTRASSILGPPILNQSKLAK